MVAFVLLSMVASAYSKDSDWQSQKMVEKLTEKQNRGYKQSESAQKLSELGVKYDLEF